MSLFLILASIFVDMKQKQFKVDDGKFFIRNLFKALQKSLKVSAKEP